MGGSLTCGVQLGVPLDCFHLPHLAPMPKLHTSILVGTWTSTEVLSLSSPTSDIYWAPALWVRGLHTISWTWWGLLGPCLCHEEIRDTCSNRGWILLIPGSEKVDERLSWAWVMAKYHIARSFHPLGQKDRQQQKQCWVYEESWSPPQPKGHCCYSLVKDLSGNYKRTQVSYLFLYLLPAGDGVSLLFFSEHKWWPTSEKASARRFPGLYAEFALLDPVQDNWDRWARVSVLFLDLVTFWSESEWLAEQSQGPFPVRTVPPHFYLLMLANLLWQQQIFRTDF